MPIELLRELAKGELPVTIREENTIDKLRVLRAADLIAVMLPPPEAAGSFARVLAITAKGRTALAFTSMVNAAASSPKPAAP